MAAKLLLESEVNMLSGKPLVMVVDNSWMFRTMIEEVLEHYGYRVIMAKEGEEALRIFSEIQPAIVLLDIMMDGIDGFTVCRRLREISDVPIIIVTARSETAFELDSFKAGANEYITKPFNTNHLIAQIEVLIRYTHSLQHPGGEQNRRQVFQCQDLRIYFERKIVTIRGQIVNLPLTEYKLLCYLARNAGRIVSSEEIVKELCNSPSHIDTNLVKVNISRLRQHLGDDDRNPRFIVTRPRLGYTLKGEGIIEQQALV